VRVAEVVIRKEALTKDKVRAADVAALSPYTTRHIRRFGDYTLDTSPPDRSVQPHLDLDENDGAEDAAGA
jgi:hypothetical protein